MSNSMIPKDLLPIIGEYVFPNRDDMCDALTGKDDIMYVVKKLLRKIVTLDTFSDIEDEITTHIYNTYQKDQTRTVISILDVPQHIAQSYIMKHAVHHINDNGTIELTGLRTYEDDDFEENDFLDGIDYHGLIMHDNGFYHDVTAYVGGYEYEYLRDKEQFPIDIGAPQREILRQFMLLGKHIDDQYNSGKRFRVFIPPYKDFDDSDE